MNVGENLVSDMLALLKQDWISDERKVIIKGIINSAIDNMKDYVEEMEKGK
jgi:hypothetical protein